MRSGSCLLALCCFFLGFVKTRGGNLKTLEGGRGWGWGGSTSMMRRVFVRPRGRLAMCGKYFTDGFLLLLLRLCTHDLLTFTG